MSTSPLDLRLQRFLEVSAALTGDAQLPAGIAGAYLERLDRAHPAQVDAMLDAVDAELAGGADMHQAIHRSLVSDDARWATAREVISIWMTSRLPSVDRVSMETVAPEQYFQGRLWAAISAHPQGLSGGYFGHWHYEPDN